MKASSWNVCRSLGFNTLTTLCSPALAALLSVPACWGAVVTANFDSALIGGNAGPQPLPMLLQGTGAGGPNSVRLRFSVPDASSIVSLNSFDISVRVYDDSDAASESGELVFIMQATPTPNLLLASFGGYGSATPFTVTTPVPVGSLADVLAEIKDDGFFQFRVGRDSGDFYVLDASVRIDAVLVPEPSAGAAAMGFGLLATASFSRRHRAAFRS